jgi:hypothetical protein
MTGFAVAGGAAIEQQHVGAAFCAFDGSVIGADACGRSSENLEPRRRDERWVSQDDRCR